MNTIALLLSLTLGVTANQEPVRPGSMSPANLCPRGTAYSFNVMSGVAFSASLGARTLVLVPNTYYSSIFVVVYVARVDAGLVTVTPTVSVDAAGTYAPIGVRDCATSPCVSVPLIDTFVPASYNLMTFEYRLPPATTHFKVIFSEPSNDSTDLFYVQACYGAGE